MLFSIEESEGVFEEPEVEMAYSEDTFSWDADCYVLLTLTL